MQGTKVLIPVADGLIELFASKQVNFFSSYFCCRWTNWSFSMIINSRWSFNIYIFWKQICFNQNFMDYVFKLCNISSTMVKHFTVLNAQAPNELQSKPDLSKFSTINYHAEKKRWRKLKEGLCARRFLVPGVSEVLNFHCNTYYGLD